jgi:hypothetical protein
VSKIEDRLKISEEKSILHSLKNKHSVYYVDGLIVKTYDELQKGVDDRRLIERLDKRTGDRRYLDYDVAKWFKVNWTK